jgi:hypothetical protein
MHGTMTVNTLSPGTIIRITIEDAVTKDPFCVIEMQPEEFALAITKNGAQRGKYLNIYKKNS